MELIFWVVAIYWVSRRYLKKHPERKAALREYLHLFIGGHTADRAAAISKKEHDKREAEQRTAQKKLRVANTQASPFTHAPRTEPAITPRKKSEKQFRQL